MSAGGLWGIAGTVLRSAAGRGGADGQGRVFHYPRRGFGQIVDVLADAAVAAGAEIETGAEVATVRPLSARVAVSTVDGTTVMAGHVLSTVPLPVLARLARPGPAAGVLADAGRLRFRAMVLVYLVHAGGRWTPYDAHYLPGPETPVTRVSEPANYRASADDPADRSVLCAEIPCAVGDPVWTSTPDELAALVTSGLAATGLPPVHLDGVAVRRLPHVYPVYEIGYADHLAGLDAWAGGLERVTTFGRLGLFAHDNTHHALAEAWDAVDALRAGRHPRPPGVDRGPPPLRRPTSSRTETVPGVELAVHGGQDPAQVRAQPDERGAGGAEGVRDRHLGVGVALAEQVEGEHLRVVVVVHHLGGRGGTGREGAVAALPVGEVGPPRGPADPAGEHPVAECPMWTHPARHRRRTGTRRRSRRCRRAPGRRARPAPPAGTRRRRPGRPRTPVAARSPRPARDGPRRRGRGCAGCRTTTRARRGGPLRARVGGAVVDHQRDHRPPTRDGRQPADHLADGRLLVVRGQHGDHRSVRSDRERATAAAGACGAAGAGRSSPAREPRARRRRRRARTPVLVACATSAAASAGPGPAPNPTSAAVAAAS